MTSKNILLQPLLIVYRLNNNIFQINFNDNEENCKYENKIQYIAKNEKQNSLKISSNHAILYPSMMALRLIDHSTYTQKFYRNRINYVHNSPYQQFSYQVERVFSFLNYYKVKVKIAHFSLTASVLKISSGNVLTNCKRVRRNCGHIYFVKFNQQNLCIKSFDFNSHSSFSGLFPSVIKQWAIHRICSALQCSPYISSAFGFDLLVFNDCIQYATEEGRQMNGFSEEDAKHLRQQMALMHSFKIMHLDIKPENTVFSPHFRQPVFIDFGFSEIIEEELGYKTLIKFKGTPNYCSHQMWSIMWEQQGHVDLYYNDAFSLEQSLKLREKHIQQVYFQQQLLQIDITSSFLQFCVFQYNYISINLIKTRQSLRLCLSIDDKNIKKILLFIKAAVGQVFIKEIFEEDLNKYRHLIEYMEIKESIKINNGKLFYKECIGHVKNSEDDSHFIIQSLISGTNLYKGFQHYFRIIISLCKLDAETATNYVSIAFQCVRFDVKFW